MKKNNFVSILNKIAFMQLISLGAISLIYLINKQYEIFSSIVISSIASFSYTQLIKLSIYNKTFALFGFPFRLLLVGLPCAILVHKLHSNLIALFIGFTISLVIYFIYIFLYASTISKE